MPVLNSHHIRLQCNLLYTAITRARRLVVLVGDLRAIATAVRNDKVLQRYGAGDEIGAVYHTVTGVATE